MNASSAEKDRALWGAAFVAACRRGGLTVTSVLASSSSDGGLIVETLVVSLSDGRVAAVEMRPGELSVWAAARFARVLAGGRATL